MLKFLFAIVFALECFPVLAQSRIDSLKGVLTTIDNDSLKIHTYLRLADAYHRLDQNLSLEYNIQAENLAKKIDLEPLIAEAKYRKGTALSNLNLFEQAELEFDIALKIFSKLGNSARIAQVKTDWAKLYQSQSKPQEAIALYFEALPLTQQLGDKNAEARIYNFLGENYKIQKQFDKAIEYYEKALLLVKELNFKPGISACLANLGTAYIEIGNLDKAIEYHKEALSIKTETGDKLGSSRVLSNLGETYSLKQQFELAERYFDKAYALALEVDNSGHMAIVEYGLARNALKRGDLKKCIKMANSIVANLHLLQDLDLAVKTHDLLFQAHLKNGNTQEALYNASVRTQLSDSLYNEKIVAVTNELDAQYQNEEKAQAIALLQSENDLQSLQIQKRENERIYLIALALVIFLTMGLVYNQYRIKQKANARLRELDKLKSDFFANISHEFRTPLSLIMGPLKERINDTVSDEDRHSYQMMYRNADRLLNLIDQLLDLSKLESKSMMLKKTSTDVGHFFKIIVASFSSLAEHKKIRFNCSLPVGSHSIELDQDVIQKICYNLLSNAFKFTTDEGEVNFIVNLQNSELKITVSDSGIGIPSGDREKIFDRFFQSANGTPVGTGIGLALTKELVEFHGGQISLVNSSAKGSTFSVAIPVESSQGLTVVQEELMAPSLDHLMTEREEESSLSGNKPVVLIIEDNLDLRNYVGEILKDTYAVYHSANGELGVTKAKEIIPDLIISDVMMPEKDGVEVCTELKASTETDHIPIVLLTARADQESKLRGLATGADDYLLKPFDPKELRVRISNLLAQRIKLKEKYSQLLLLEPAEIEVTSSQDFFLKKAKEIVTVHLDNSDFSAEDFCSEMGMSRMQLHRKLKALTGQSTTAFVRQQRLNRASQLLGRGEPVSQVAYAVGFSSLSYFTKNFKQEFGVAPSEYKQKSM